MCKKKKNVMIENKYNRKKKLKKYKNRLRKEENQTKYILSNMQMKEKCEKDKVKNYSGK